VDHDVTTFFERLIESHSSRVTEAAYLIMAEIVGSGRELCTYTTRSGSCSPVLLDDIRICGGSKPSVAGVVLSSANIIHESPQTESGL
jgi:hypothetical protein